MIRESLQFWTGHLGITSCGASLYFW
uniref:Uncharacterized protein n=1 Tax=Arundo donax TaxID=35708 RepID=A0A0A8Z1P8_ARUDO